MDLNQVQQRPLDPQTECPLFKLPPELRNEVYSLVFNVKLNDDGRVNLRKFFSPLDRAVTSLSILGTCRLIRGEALAMFNGIYDFELGLDDVALTQLKGFSRCSTRARLEAIKTLTVRTPDYECVRGLMTHLKKFKGMTTLTIVIQTENAYGYDVAKSKSEMTMWKKAARLLPQSVHQVRFLEQWMDGSVQPATYGDRPDDTSRFQAFEDWLKEFLETRRSRTRVHPRIQISDASETRATNS